MITITGITLFHRGYDRETRMDVYQKQFFPACSMQKDNVVTLTEGGLKSADVVKIRIPTLEEIIIKNGDKLVIGFCESAAPPKESAYNVTGFADNRKGSKQVQHWKVVAG